MIAALTGFMACGKSTFGRAAASALKCRFIDLDDEITSRFGTPATIFEEGGESLFRKRENEVLSEILEHTDNAILALGGGTVLFQSNMKLLREKGVRVIWLDTSFDIICGELHNSKRPLVDSKSVEEVKSLFEERRPKYHAAADRTVIIDSTDYNIAIDNLTKEIRTILCL